MIKEAGVGPFKKKDSSILFAKNMKDLELDFVYL